MTATTDPDIIGRCQHCGIAQYRNPQADPALSSMAHLCWKCVKPWSADFQPGQYVKLASQPGVIGRFVRYYLPLASGTRNVEIDWNDPQLTLTVTEHQIVAL